eukprot:Clim_evm24s169 gene=Clim_evmTU24s169
MVGSITDSNPDLALYVMGEGISVPARVVSASLAYADIPFEKRSLALSKGEHKAPEYLKINPRGLVPVLEEKTKDAGNDEEIFRLTESYAIIDYLTKTHAAHLQPKDPKAQARVAEFLQWIRTTLWDDVLSLGVQVFFMPMIGTPDQEKIETLKKNVVPKLEFLEKYYLSDIDEAPINILGRALGRTVADSVAFVLLNHLYSVGLDGLNDGAQFPKIRAFVEAMRALPELAPYVDPVSTEGRALLKQN